MLLNSGVAKALFVFLCEGVRTNADGEADLLPHNHHLINKFVELIP